MIEFLTLSAILLQILSINAFPASSHVDCNLVSVSMPSEPWLLGRTTVMGLVLTRDPDVPIVVSTLVEENNTIKLTIGDNYQPGIVAFTDSGTIELITAGQGTEPGSDSCAPNFDILYGILPDTEIRWTAATNESKVWVFQSGGPGTSFNIETFDLNSTFVDEDTSDVDTSDDDGVGESEQTDENELDFKDTLFNLFVILFTVIYGFFLWDTLKPETH